MIKCEKCLYRKNCQFLATHKKTAVEGCTAFKSESDLKAEAFKELLDKMIDKSVCKDNGDGTERLFVSIETARETVKEMVGEMDV